MTVAFAGLALIGLTVGSDLRWSSLALALAGAFSWAVGNVLLKRTADVPVFSLVTWASLVPPLPALLITTAYDHRPLLTATLSASWLSLAEAVYLGVMATVVAYATWGYLLQRYSTAAVAPFALLGPCTGVLASAVAFGPMRYAGMALILAGLAIAQAGSRRRISTVPAGSERTV